MEAFDNNYITKDELKNFKGKEIERTLNGYISYLRTKRDTKS